MNQKPRRKKKPDLHKLVQVLRKQVNILTKEVTTLSRQIQCLEERFNMVLYGESYD
jgi:hypothetical protein